MRTGLNGDSEDVIGAGDGVYGRGYGRREATRDAWIIGGTRSESDGAGRGEARELAFLHSYVEVVGRHAGWLERRGRTGSDKAALSRKAYTPCSGGTVAHT